MLVGVPGMADLLARKHRRPIVRPGGSAADLCAVLGRARTFLKPGVAHKAGVSCRGSSRISVMGCANGLLISQDAPQHICIPHEQPVAEGGCKRPAAKGPIQAHGGERKQTHSCAPVDSVGDTHTGARCRCRQQVILIRYGGMLRPFD